MVELKYRRILLKISGEALSGVKTFGIDQDKLYEIAESICDLNKAGVRVAVVVGGGNFWRGRSSVNMDRTTADYMGMLATVINALALQDAIEAKGIQTRVQTAIEMRQIAEPYIRRKALTHLEENRVVIFACGTGSPYFSTDTTAALRAAEMNAEVILKATKVDGIYDSDPMINKDARKFDRLSYIEVLNMGLGVMDSTATTLCMENKIPIIVFCLNEHENMMKVVCGEKIGTIVN